MTRAYQVDLSDMDMWPYWNVSDCKSSSPDSCDNWNMTLNATLTNNLACDINKTIPFINNVNVDAISFTDGIECCDRYFFMLRSNDNNDDDAYVFFFCFHPFAAHGNHSGGHDGHDGNHHHHNSAAHTYSHDHPTGSKADDDSSIGTINLLFVNGLSLCVLAKMFAK